jgi:hypothetical protein
MWLVMFWLGLAWKAAALAWLRVALASRISKPSQSPHPWLGFGWLWPKPWLEAEIKFSAGVSLCENVFSAHNLETLRSDKGSSSPNYCKAEPSALSPKAITGDSVHPAMPASMLIVSSSLCIRLHHSLARLPLHQRINTHAIIYVANSGSFSAGPYSNSHRFAGMWC